LFCFFQVIWNLYKWSSFNINDTPDTLVKHFFFFTEKKKSLYQLRKEYSKIAIFAKYTIGGYFTISHARLREKISRWDNQKTKPRYVQKDILSRTWFQFETVSFFFRALWNLYKWSYFNIKDTHDALAERLCFNAKNDLFSAVEGIFEDTGMMTTM